MSRTLHNCLVALSLTWTAVGLAILAHAAVVDGLFVASVRSR